VGEDTSLGLLERANLNLEHRTMEKVQKPSNSVCYTSWNGIPNTLQMFGLYYNGFGVHLLQTRTGCYCIYILSLEAGRTTGTTVYSHVVHFTRIC
jgi:hypothetical protein